MVIGSGKSQVKMPLTHRSIEALKPAVYAYRVPDTRCPGLGVRVAPSGSKSWDAVFRIRGTPKIKRKSLGSFPAVSLEAARQRAGALASAAQAGRDLLDEEAAAKAEAAARATVAELIDEYVKRACGKLRTRREIDLRLHRALESIAHKPAEAIKRRDLRCLFDAVSDRGAQREAEKQRQSVGAMFGWAVGQDIVQDNPVRGLKPYSSGELRDRVLSAPEIAIFWKWLTTSDLTVDMSDVLRLQLCLGSRVGEVSGIIDSEIDQETWLWTLPAARSKNKRPRVTPIVGLARQILEERIRGGKRGPLFVNERGKALGSNDVGSAIVTRRKRIPLDHFVSHDLRRTVATELINLGISFDVVAAVLGHEHGDKGTRTLSKHYVRSDLIPQKRVALHAWDTQLRYAIDGRVKAPHGVVLSDVLLKQAS